MIEVVATPSELVGIGLYTPAEAAYLLGIGAGKIVRWLRGHQVKEHTYPRLWRPQIDLGDGKIYLGFRDLMETRIANLFITKAQLSPIKVRKAIEIAQAMTGYEHPLSTTWLKTDGRTVFLELVQADGTTRMIDLFKSQHVFREMIAPSLKDVDFDEAGVPERWWPAGKAGGIVVDPKRAFGRPIEVKSAVPAEILAAAATAEGSARLAAKVWDVPEASVKRSIKYMVEFNRRAA